MIFNGHTHESIADLDDLTMAQIQTMYADGVIGNHGILQNLATLITGVFNYIRSANSAPHKMENILGLASDYLFPPLPEEYKKEKTNQQLLTFMAQAPGFNMDRFNHG